MPGELNRVAKLDGLERVIHMPRLHTSGTSGTMSMVPVAVNVSEGISPPSDVTSDNLLSLRAPNEMPHTPCNATSCDATSRETVSNSSRNSTGETEHAREWEFREDSPGESTAIEAPKSTSVLVAEASYPEVEGPGQEAAEETLGCLKRYKSCVRNESMSHPRALLKRERGPNTEISLSASC